ncbi:hypothetical protein Nepgr_002687 [Nepenthes gracilis]|uniref:Uncharacterized protein n=1 Tax=Nepenthes gracilis TaxID=150966 RepID=A0AAD3P943_NEPGR|nr:hypothetical protein Nepgr_002687 [Nepenthes gracilis]
MTLMENLSLIHGSRPRRRSKGMETRGQQMRINVSRHEAGGSRFNILANSLEEDDSPSDNIFALNWSKFLDQGQHSQQGKKHHLSLHFG